MMAFITLPRLVSNDVFKNRLLLNSVSLVKVQSASMTSKENRDPSIVKPAPWPYRTKKFTLLKEVYESTMKRFDENTKVVIVDGNIGAGKSSFAKQLAEAFDFEYFPEPTIDRYFITDYGYDLRKMDELLPASFKCCDLKTYYSNPHHVNVPTFQFILFAFRLEQYINALAHVLNTGQGVVLERCVYGDFVFTETMAKFGYLSPRVMNYYKDVTKNVLEELMRPHLIVYLDVSPEVALERIKKRNDPAEVNSKVLTKEYLTSIEQLYKQKYLKQMQKHAEILVYDWSNYGDIEVVVEDIERIDFNRYSIYDKKMSDWKMKYDWQWGERRRFYTNDKWKIMNYAYIFRPSVEELFKPREDVIIFEELLSKIPGNDFRPGYNANAGESVLFNTKDRSYFDTVIYRKGF